MSNMDENLERLIVRSLDGDLSEDEQLDLDRELIRNPDALRLMEEYGSIDRLAVASLEALVCNDDFHVEAPSEIGAQRERRGRHHRGWMLVSGAIAAAVLAIVIPRSAILPPEQREAIVQKAAPTTPRDFPGVRELQNQGMMHSVANGVLRPSVQRRTGRDLIGVIGDDGNLYWIEVERTRTVRFPQRRRLEGGGPGEL